MEKFHAERICQHCQHEMLITADNINDVVKYRGKYYHQACFVAYMQTRMAKEPQNAERLQSILINIDKLVSSAKSALMQTYNRDALNEYLLQHYTVVGFSGRFWQKVADLANGKYNNRPSIAVGTDELLDMWRWAQKDLDSIYKYNRENGNDMVGENRVHYDLAVVIRKYGEYKQAKSQMKIDAMKYANIKSDKLNISKIKSPTKNTSQDISDILGDIFGGGR